MIFVFRSIFGIAGAADLNAWPFLGSLLHGQNVVFIYISSLNVRKSDLTIAITAQHDMTFDSIEMLWIFCFKTCMAFLITVFVMRFSCIKRWTHLKYVIMSRKLCLWTIQSQAICSWASYITLAFNFIILIIASIMHDVHARQQTPNEFRDANLFKARECKRE